MFNLHRFICYLLRMPRTYGFGVQSPFAYRFVREVVCGHTPITKSVSNGFVNGELDRSLQLNSTSSSSSTFGSLPKGQKLVYRLLSRLYSFSHADACFVPSDCNDSVLCDMLSSLGCRIDKCFPSIQEVKFSVISTQFRDYHLLLELMAEDGMLIVLGIRTHRRDYDYWKLLISDPRAFVSFDLYDLGVIFFDPKMYKRNYRCNLR